MAELVAERPTSTDAPPQADGDAALLEELGYKQELHRGMSGFSNFATSFSIISILSGCLTTYYLAMDAGGPSALTSGWILVSLPVLAVALAMAEICSSFPIAGGLYWWAGRLARSRQREWAWTVGWFNFLGEVAITASVDYGCAVTWAAVYAMATGHSVSLLGTFAIFAVVLVSHGLLNTFGVSLVQKLSTISAWWHLAGVTLIVVALWLAPIPHKPLSWVFGHYVNNTGFAGHHGFFGTPVYGFMIGLLTAQFTLTGYDASAHVAEETVNASTAAPRGIVNSVLISQVAGLVLLVSVTAAIQDYDKARAAAGAAGLPPAQIFIDALGGTFGLALVVVCGVAQYFCGMACVTANSRMAYAFARDNALPGSRWWSRINRRSGTPTNSIWLCAGLALLLTVPAIFSATAFSAVTSIAVIGLSIAYATPVLLRRLNPDFRTGPWNLGRWSAVVGWIAVAWVAFAVVLFLLPQYAPGTFGDATFNYAPIAVGVVALIALVGWFAGGRECFMHRPSVLDEAGDVVLPVEEVLA